MKTFKRLALMYAGMLATFTALIILVFCLPAKPIKKHVAESARQVSEEGVWWKPCGVFLFQVDNMTDCIMMGISACDNQKSPLRAAMLDERAVPADDADLDLGCYHIDRMLYDDATGSHRYHAVYSNYARYWHGYQVVLRPMLSVMNYSQIRVVNYVALTLLALIVALMLYKRAGTWVAASFVATLVVGNFMVVPLAMQFCTCFYIAFVAMIVFLARPACLQTTTNRILSFFTIGAVCSYMDFLTTPVLTLGMPIVALWLIDKRLRFVDMAKCCMAWLGGYALLWASKWGLAWLLTGYNTVGDALHSAETRVGSTIIYGGKEMPITSLLAIATDKIGAYVSVHALIAVAVVASVATSALVVRKRKTLRQNICLVAVALMPLIWFAVMKNHSIQHIFFTWRDWFLTLWAVLLLIQPKLKPRKP